MCTAPLFNGNEVTLLQNDRHTHHTVPRHSSIHVVPSRVGDKVMLTENDETRVNGHPQFDMI